MRAAAALTVIPCMFCKFAVSSIDLQQLAHEREGTMRTGQSCTQNPYLAEP